MITYKDYLEQLTTKRDLWNLTYREVGEQTGVTKQNIHSLFKGKSMGSFDSYRALDKFFRNEITFDEYANQFKELLKDENLKELSYIFDISVLGLQNILDAKHKANYSHYMILEEFLCQK